MNEVNRLETSMTKTEAKAKTTAFVTLRFVGDDLDPGEISAVLPVTPTRMHRKGEEFFAGPHAGRLRGRTGIWFLSTDKIVSSEDLRDHLHFVEHLFYPEPDDNSRITALKAVLARAHALAHVTCFWRGDPGKAAPEFPRSFSVAIEPLAADIETDFAPA
jgi:hypothetical protein